MTSREASVPVATDRSLDLSVHETSAAASAHRRAGSASAAGAGFLPDAQQRRDAGVVGRPDLERHHGVVLAEVPPAFGVADFHEPDAQFGEERRRHFPGPRAVRPAAVLRSEDQRRAGNDLAGGRQHGKGRDDERDHPPGREGRTGVHFMPQLVQPAQAVPVAEVHLGADADVDGACGAGGDGLCHVVSCRFVLGLTFWGCTARRPVAVTPIGHLRQPAVRPTFPAVRRPCSGTSGYQTSWLRRGTAARRARRHPWFRCPMR